MRKFKNDPVGVVAHIIATPMRNADGLWRIPQASVELQLPEGNQDYAQLQRILGQFERFCVVTQSVRQGIDVQVLAGGLAIVQSTLSGRRTQAAASLQ